MVVAIIGLGLMGGSFGKVLRKRVQPQKIIGYDHNTNHCKEALKLKLIDEIVSFEEVKKADIIILAIPVEGIIATLKKLADIDKKTTIIDLGSTKSKIVKEVPSSIRKNLVAAHPMAGTEKFGPSAAIDNLYENQIVVLCDIEENLKLHRQRAIELFTQIGMKIVYMEANDHDRHAAFISHLPHAISFALANTVMRQEDPKSIVALAVGGFKDMSRIAKSSPKMWSDIFKQNNKNLLESIEYFQKELKLAKKLIKKKKWDELEDWMRKATTLHNIL